MKHDTNTQILLQYEERRQDYIDFALCIANLINRILEENNIRIHSVTSRAKTVKSLRDKISRPEKNYPALNDITDLAGIRIITYFPDQIDKVIELLNQEFNIDKSRSIDKRLAKAPDSFGYSSVHKICSLSSARSHLSEYRRFKNLTCEIQVRSILQHTWAEIEHDLGYKNTIGVPDKLRVPNKNQV